MMPLTEATPAQPHASTACPDTGNSAPDPSAGRDSRGRFTRGNKGGPGNPFNRRVAGLRQLLLQRVSDDDLGAIVDRLVEKAKEGDLGAARLVLCYTVGKPASVVDPDRLDVEEFNLFCEEAVSGEQVAAPLKGIPAALACEIAHAALPPLTASKAQQLGAALAAVDQDEDETAETGAAEEKGNPSLPVEPVADNAAAVVTTAQQGDRRTPRQTRAKREKNTTTGTANGRQEHAPGVELPSVSEILSFFPQMTATTAAAAHAPAAARAAATTPTERGTDYKRAETARRCANVTEFLD